jgi:hypothetical protein
VQDLHAENYEVLVDTIKVESLILHLFTFKCSIVPIKISARFFLDIDNIFLKLLWKGRETRVVRTISRLHGISEG